MPGAFEGVFNESFTQDTADNQFQSSRVKNSVLLTGEPEKDKEKEVIRGFFFKLYRSKALQGQGKVHRSTCNKTR